MFVWAPCPLISCWSFGYKQDNIWTKVMTGEKSVEKTEELRQISSSSVISIDTEMMCKSCVVKVPFRTCLQCCDKMAASGLLYWAVWGSGRFPLCHSSADDHISSVVTNVITYGCLWATVHMQGSLQVRGGCLSSPAAQFKGFVSPGGCLEAKGN